MRLLQIRYNLDFGIFPTKMQLSFQETEEISFAWEESNDLEEFSMESEASDTEKNGVAPRYNFHQHNKGRITHFLHPWPEKELSFSEIVPPPPQL